MSDSSRVVLVELADDYATIISFLSKILKYVLLGLHLIFYPSLLGIAPSLA